MKILKTLAQLLALTLALAYLSGCVVAFPRHDRPYGWHSPGRPVYIVR